MSTPPRRSGVRTRLRPYAALFGGLALVATLAACGSDGGDDTATDPNTSSDTSQTPDEPATSDTPTLEPGLRFGTIPATGSAGVTEVTLVDGTEAGGSASTLAWALDTDRAIADFTGQFEQGFGEVLTSAVNKEAAPDATTYAATVAVGCDAPRSVAIGAGEAGFEVTPELPKKGVQCLAPITYVVVFAAPDA